MPDPKTIPATVTACTLDPQGRTALFHLSATSPSGEALSLLFPLRFPTLEELEAERGGVEILSDTEDQGEEEEQRADACPGCGCSVKWSCGTDEYPTGRADCEDGRMVSLRLGTGPSCPWPGATVFRLLGQVYVPMPLVTK